MGVVLRTVNLNLHFTLAFEFADLLIADIFKNVTPGDGQRFAVWFERFDACIVGVTTNGKELLEVIEELGLEVALQK